MLKENEKAYHYDTFEYKDLFRISIDLHLSYAYSSGRVGTFIVPKEKEEEFLKKIDCTKRLTEEEATKLAKNLLVY